MQEALPPSDARGWRPLWLAEKGGKWKEILCFLRLTALFLTKPFCVENGLWQFAKLVVPSDIALHTPWATDDKYVFYWSRLSPVTPTNISLVLFNNRRSQRQRSDEKETESCHSHVTGPSRQWRCTCTRTARRLIPRHTKVWKKRRSFPIDCTNWACWEMAGKGSRTHLSLPGCDGQRCSRSRPYSSCRVACT